MGKLNKGSSVEKQLSGHKDATKNYEGGLAFKQDKETELYSRVVSCLVNEPKFYKQKDEHGNITAENQDEEILKLVPLVAKENPEFILQLAAHARNQMNLRTIPQMLLVEASLIKDCKPFVRAYTPDIVKRADEMAEDIAYAMAKLGQFGARGSKGVVLPHSLQKGLQKVIHSFTHYKGDVSSYTLSKYNRDGAVKLKDVLNLVHPKPVSDAESALFKSVLDGTIQPADTWEVTLSTWKEKGFASKKDAWEAIISKMPVMATIRNLRNFLDEGISDDSMKLVYSRLTDEKAIRHSKQLPFRFFSAYREIQNGAESKWKTKLMDALQIAMDISVDNLPRLKGTWFITADVSGSMGAAISERSSVSRWDISTLMLCIAHKMCEHAITSVFDGDHRIANLSSRDGVLTNMEKVARLGRGGTTDAYLTALWLRQQKEKVDGMILLSDMQCYDTGGDIDYYTSAPERSFAAEWIKYTREVNKDAYLFSVDLAGYGTIQVPQDTQRVALIAGWSERLLNFIPKFMEDGTQAVQEIKKIRPGQFSANKEEPDGQE